MAKGNLGMSVEVKENMLVISIPLNDPPVPSASGKTKVVASSKGNVQTDAVVEYKGSEYPITVGVNAYIKA